MADDRGTSWSDQETTVLIEIWGDSTIQRALDGAKHNSKVYERVSARMQIRGYKDRTALKCQNKMKRLKEKYREELKRVNKSGAGGRINMWRFFDPIDAIIGDRPTCTPPVLLQTGRLSVRSPTPSSSNLGSDEAGDDEEPADEDGSCSFAEQQANMNNTSTSSGAGNQTDLDDMTLPELNGDEPTPDTSTSSVASATAIVSKPREKRKLKQPEQDPGTGKSSKKSLAAADVSRLIDIFTSSQRESDGKFLVMEERRIAAEREMEQARLETMKQMEAKRAEMDMQMRAQEQKHEQRMMEMMMMFMNGSAAQAPAMTMAAPQNHGHTYQSAASVQQRQRPPVHVARDTSLQTGVKSQSFSNIPPFSTYGPYQNQ
ncbi:uncharacterized protein LOC135489676 [Lineus longissimus]|uniref:uncharacterized protein LOC135489676 n=1 Tax=Lineus longissimus TaxID=88925 RepID=UPI00315CBD69